MMSGSEATAGSIFSGTEHSLIFLRTSPRTNGISGQRRRSSISFPMKSISVTVFTLKDKLRETVQSKDNAEKWLSLIRKYTNLTMLTAPILNELIEKIVVHEATKDKDGKRIQKIEIYYRFVGKIDD